MKHRQSEACALAILWRELVDPRVTKHQIAAMTNCEDPPDFCADVAGRRVAIEHTEIFRSVRVMSEQSRDRIPPQHEVRIQERIQVLIFEALRRLHQDGGTALDVTIQFADCAAVKRPDEASIAEKTLDLIRTLANRGTVDVFAPGLVHIHPCLGRLTVVSGAALAESRTSAQGVVEEWGLPEFERAARAKEDGLARYSERFDECWLLLEVGGVHPLQWIEPSPEACRHGIATKFDRVFVVDGQTEKVWEIAALRGSRGGPG